MDPLFMAVLGFVLGLGALWAYAGWLWWNRPPVKRDKAHSPRKVDDGSKSS